MATSHANDKASEARASRNKARPAVVPAIPLPYIQQRRNKSTTTPLQQSSPSTSTNISPSNTSPTVSGAEDSVKSKKENAQPTKERAVKSVPNGDERVVMSAPAKLAADITLDHLTLDDGPGKASSPGDPPAADLPSLVSPPDSRQSSESSHTFTLPPEFAFPYPPPVADFPVTSLPSMPRPLDQYHPAHQPRRSDGSLIFGTLHDSNNTSPAPLSGDMFPPPGLPMPYLAFPGPGFGDWTRSGLPPFALAGNGYPAMAPTFDPSSPHSFHDSQSSVQTEENGYSRNTLPNGLNGHNGLHSDAPPVAPHRQPPPPGPLGVDPRQLEFILGNVQQSFGAQEFVDCQLHIQLTKDFSSAAVDRGPAADQLTIVGHRVILAQSKTLARVFRDQSMDGNQQYTLGLQDPYVTSEALQLAIRAMYGQPLDDIPIRTNDTDGRAVGLSKALATLTAGYFFEVPYVEFHGVTQALRFLDWGNIENALGFCLNDARNLYGSSANGGVIPCFEAFFKYGRGYAETVRALMHGIMGFVINNFPHNFVLDSTVADPSYARIPLDLTSDASSTSASVNSTAASQATHSAEPNSSFRSYRQHSQPQRRGPDPRLSRIRFGDLSPPTVNGNTPKNGLVDLVANGSRLSPVIGPDDELRSTLSRILLNIPFDLVKIVLENPQLGDVSGWMPADVRLRIMREVVAERESRRLHAIKQLRSDQTDQLKSVLLRLEDSPPLAPGQGDEYNVLGWKEEVAQGTDVPRMIHAWAPLPAADASQ